MLINNFLPLEGERRRRPSAGPPSCRCQYRVSQKIFQALLHHPVNKSTCIYKTEVVKTKKLFCSNFQPNYLAQSTQAKYDGSLVFLDYLKENVQCHEIFGFRLFLLIRTPDDGVFPVRTSLENLPVKVIRVFSWSPMSNNTGGTMLDMS